MSHWVDLCAEDDIDEDDLVCREHDGHLYAIYRTGRGYFATDGHCTHESQSLEEGLVIDCVIECPLHGGRFDICTGRALSAPVSIDLNTYPVMAREGRILVQLP